MKMPLKDGSSEADHSPGNESLEGDVAAAGVERDGQALLCVG